MGVFNRVVVVLLSLAVIVAAVLLLAMPDATLGAVTRTVQGFWNDLVGGGAAWVITNIAAILLILLALLVLALELVPRRQRTVRIRVQGRGDARLRVDSVAQTLEYRIDELPGVSKVVPRLVSRGRDLAVLLEVDAAPEANIPALSDQIIDRTIRILEGELGLQIRGRVGLHISHEAVRAEPQLRPELQARPEPAVIREGPVTAARPAATPSALTSETRIETATRPAVEPAPSPMAPVTHLEPEVGRPEDVVAQRPPATPPERPTQAEPLVPPSEMLEEELPEEEPIVPLVPLGEAPPEDWEAERVEEDEDLLFEEPSQTPDEEEDQEAPPADERQAGI